MQPARIEFLDKETFRQHVFLLEMAKPNVYSHNMNTFIHLCKLSADEAVKLMFTQETHNVFP